MNQEPSASADQHRDPPESAGGQAGRVARHRESELVGGRPHPGRGCRRDQLGPAQGPRNGGHRDAGASGHVGHRGDRRFRHAARSFRGVASAEHSGVFRLTSGHRLPHAEPRRTLHYKRLQTWPRRPCTHTLESNPPMTEQVLLATDRTLDANWWRQASVYQIYPRSFADSDGNGIGDLAGVTSRMGYLAELGVDAIWLSPFYPSALADGGYDVADYRDVAPELGTLADFDAMVGRGARRRHQDHRRHRAQPHLEPAPVVPGGAGRGARLGRTRPLHLPRRHRPGRLRSRRRTGSRTSAVRPGPGCPDGQWYCHLFAPEQPDLNWDNREVRDDFLRTLRFWADRGRRRLPGGRGARAGQGPVRAAAQQDDRAAGGAGRHRPAVRPQRGARDLRRVAGGLRLLRPAPDRGGRGVRPVGRRAARCTPGRPAWARRSTSTCCRPTSTPPRTARWSPTTWTRRCWPARRRPGCCPTTTWSGTPRATGCPPAPTTPSG